VRVPEIACFVGSSDGVSFCVGFSSSFINNRIVGFAPLVGRLVIIIIAGCFSAAD